jgi:hypothetical protein
MGFGGDQGGLNYLELCDFCFRKTHAEPFHVWSKIFSGIGFLYTKVVPSSSKGMGVYHISGFPFSRD